MQRKPTILVQNNDFDANQLTQSLFDSGKGQTGAIVSFIGYVRDYQPNQTTDTLFLEHYPGMCEREITELCNQAMQRWDIIDCTVVHRVGELPYTDQIVYVGVSSVHRGQAFMACEFIIDTLKTRAPFWKRETLKDGDSFWVQQNESDARKTASWAQSKISS